MGELSLVRRGGAGVKIYTETDGLLTVVENASMYTLTLTLPNGKTWADIDVFWATFTNNASGFGYRYDTATKINTHAVASGYVLCEHASSSSMTEKSVSSSASVVELAIEYEAGAFSDLKLRLSFK